MPVLVCATHLSMLVCVVLASSCVMSHKQVQLRDCMLHVQHKVYAWVWLCAAAAKI